MDSPATSPEMWCAGHGTVVEIDGVPDLTRSAMMSPQRAPVRSDRVSAGSPQSFQVSLFAVARGRAIRGLRQCRRALLGAFAGVVGLDEVWLGLGQILEQRLDVRRLAVVVQFDRPAIDQTVGVVGIVEARLRGRALDGQTERQVGSTGLGGGQFLAGFLRRAGQSLD